MDYRVFTQYLQQLSSSTQPQPGASVKAQPIAGDHGIPTSDQIIRPPRSNNHGELASHHGRNIFYTGLQRQKDAAKELKLLMRDYNAKKKAEEVKFNLRN